MKSKFISILYAGYQQPSCFHWLCEPAYGRRFGQGG